MRRLLLAILVAGSVLLVQPSSAWSQPVDTSQPIVTRTQATGGAAIAFLYASFCALWAMQTRRNPVGWFIVGFIFSVFAAAAVLYQAGQDRKKPAAGVSPSA